MVGEVLYLHGRGDTPACPPGPLVGDVFSSQSLRAPHLDGSWLAQRFSLQVATVDDWLGEAPLGIGHSYGAWLLLSATVERWERGSPVPPLLLLSAVLGVGGSGQVGYIAPGAKKVGRALGLMGAGTDGKTLPSGLLTFIHGAVDDQCPAALLGPLEDRYRVEFVPGGHRLDDPGAQEAVRTALMEHRQRL